MTKKQKEDYKLVRPKSKKFTLTDLAKYCNSADKLPYYVSWGGEVNAAHFHNNMVDQWTKDDTVFNELYYKKVIAKKILFAYIESVISEQTWYQERRAYRPQLVTYTFSKLIQEVGKLKREINYLQIWEKQSVAESFYNDIASIGKLIFDIIYDENRTTANIETYCKKEECWKIVSKSDYVLTDEITDNLVDCFDSKIEDTQARKDQKLQNSILDEIGIFNKGSSYWDSLRIRGKENNILTIADENTLQVASKYCNGIYVQLSKFQIKGLLRIVGKLQDNGIV